MIALAWQFDVKTGRERAFEEFYGPNGPWAALSRRSRSYLGSSFLRDMVEGRRYVVIEYWAEMVFYEKHLTDYSQQVERLEQERTELLDGAEQVGLFQALNVPDRTGPTWSQRSGGS
jgi:hypothetical protein